VPAYTVTMSVDGAVVFETINGCKDGQEAIKKAKDKHPTLVIGVAPFEAQLALEELRPEDHPGQTNLDDRPDLSMEMAPPPPHDQPEDDDLMAALKKSLEQPEDADEFDGNPFPETTPDGPFEEAAANPLDESVPDPAHMEAVLAEMRGPDGSDEDGFDS